MPLGLTREYAKAITGALYDLARKRTNPRAKSENRGARRLINLLSGPVRDPRNAYVSQTMLQHFLRVANIPEETDLTKIRGAMATILRTLRAALAESPTAPELERANELLWALLKDAIEHGSVQ